MFDRYTKAVLAKAARPTALVRSRVGLATVRARGEPARAVLDCSLGIALNLPNGGQRWHSDRQPLLGRATGQPGE
jgi:hypothetical protein